LENGFGHIGVRSTATMNQVVVADPLSLSTNSADVFVSDLGSMNLLIDTNGGRVADVNGYIGYGLNSTGNVALISGAGSLWTNRGNLYVGWSGCSNQLILTNSGAAIVASNFYLGINLDAMNNST